eukprot:CAMPEP_0194033458 /NCGR_PEP_ID=MMETSP0009_2-20130614/6149_1 /TAXON_ID=210454 /ORGANISM="Grammatophora oceanica, Strain CCMP 410" /LENGTH=392 /DNA_ID=CAMNT_0038674157 /DNA_START=86 /DNA_END=1264 /DNA_ORIENTATION=-
MNRARASIVLFSLGVCSAQGLETIASDRELQSNYRPPWWKAYRGQFGEEFKRCKSLQGVAPESESQCDKKRIVRDEPKAYGYFCMFGSVSCQSDVYEGDIHPDKKCTCADGTWSCETFDNKCSTIEATLPETTPGAPVEKTPVDTGTEVATPASTGNRWAVCMARTSCGPCLSEGCAWALGKCFPECMFLSDGMCYSADTPEEVETQCSSYDSMVADVETCSEAGDDCETCTSTTVPSTNEPCFWSDHGFGRGKCGPFCGFGSECGSQTCSDTTETESAINLGSCKASNCLECVTQGCGWAAGRICVSNCGFLADAACFEGADAQAVCNKEEATRLDAQACSENRDCASCVATNMPSSGSPCQWKEFLNGRGFCQSACGMLGCGETTCSASA